MIEAFPSDAEYDWAVEIMQARAHEHWLAAQDAHLWAERHGA